MEVSPGWYMLDHRSTLTTGTLNWLDVTDGSFPSWHTYIYKLMSDHRSTLKTGNLFGLIEAGFRIWNFLEVYDIGALSPINSFAWKHLAECSCKIG